MTAREKEQFKREIAERDRLAAENRELIAALSGMVRIADRATPESDAARAVLAKAQA